MPDGGPIGRLFVSLGADVSEFDRGLGHVDKGMQQAAGSAERHTGSIRSAFEGLGKAITAPISAVGNLGNALGRLGLAVMGIDALTQAATGLGRALGIGLNMQMEQARMQMLALTKDAGQTASLMALVQREADKTAFSYEGMNKAVTMLIPSARMSGEAIEDLLHLTQLLAATNPEQGIEGAAFALREAVSGDFVSLMTRFNIPRSLINQLKEEGLPAIEIVRRSLAEMGIDMSLVAAQSETLAGKWDIFTGGINRLRAQISEPIFDRMKAGLDQASQWLEDNRETVETWAANVAAGIGLAIDAAGALARGFASGLGAALNVVVSVGRAIYEALSWLNPFASHSPPLVEEVDRGVDEMIGSFSRLQDVSGGFDSVRVAVRGFTGAITGSAEDVSRSLAGMPGGLRYMASALGDTTYAAEGFTESLDRQVKTVYDVDTAVRRFKEGTTDIKDALSAADGEVSRLKDHIAGYRDELNRLSGVDVLGTKQFKDRAFELRQQMSAIEKEMAEKKLVMPALVAPPSDADKSTREAYQRAQDAQRAALAPLEQRREQLRLQMDVLRAEEELTLDPLRKNLEEIKKPAVEMPYMDLAFSLGQARGEVEQLTPELKIAEEATKRLKEEKEALAGAAGGGGGAGGAAGGVFGKGGLKVPEIDTSALAKFQEKVTLARAEFEETWGRWWDMARLKWYEFQFGVLDPMASVWTRVADAWKEKGLVGALKEGGDITGEVGAWLGKQWSQIEWTPIWNQVTGLTTSFAKGVGSIYIEVQGWLSEQWKALSWKEVWKDAPPMDKATADWIAMQEGREASKAFRDWLGGNLKGGADSIDFAVLFAGFGMPMKVMNAFLDVEGVRYATNQARSFAIDLVWNMRWGIEDAIGGAFAGVAELIQKALAGEFNRITVSTGKVGYDSTRGVYFEPPGISVGPPAKGSGTGPIFGRGEPTEEPGLKNPPAPPPPYTGEWAHGGTIPGPVGSPFLATVHGGERITPAGQQTQLQPTVLHFHMPGGEDVIEEVLARPDVVDRLARGLTRWGRLSDERGGATWALAQ